MKSKFYTFLTIVLVLTSLNINAQNFNIGDLTDFYTEIGRSNSSKHRQQTYEDIAGSPYLEDDFIEGTIIRNDGTTYEKIPLRYNGYDDHIEFRDKNGLTLFLDNPEEFKEIKIEGKKFIYYNLVNSKQKVQGYFELLEGSKTQLLKKYSIKIKDPEPAKAYRAPTPASFVSKPICYFILQNENQLFEIRNDKNIIELLNDKNNEMQRFIKKNKLKVKKEEDLKQIVAYYNSL